MDPCGDVSPIFLLPRILALRFHTERHSFPSYLQSRTACVCKVCCFFSNVVDSRFTVYPEYVARALSDYLTAETGVKIIFESAIVPKWKDSRISFKNVYVVRRPTVARERLQNEVQATAIGYDIINHPLVHGSGEDEEEPHFPDLSEEDTNYTQFDLTIDSIDVTLSLWRWLDGKGLVEDAVIKGVRGILGEFLLSTQSAPIYPSAQTAGQLLGTPTIRSTRACSDTVRNLATLSSNRFSSKTCSSPSTNQENSDHILHLSSGLMSARSGNNGCSTIFFPQRMSWDSLITACSVCTSLKALGVPTNKIYWTESGHVWCVPPHLDTN